MLGGTSQDPSELLLGGYEREAFDPRGAAAAGLAAARLSGGGRDGVWIRVHFDRWIWFPRSGAGFRFNSTEWAFTINRPEPGKTLVAGNRAKPPKNTELVAGSETTRDPTING